MLGTPVIAGCWLVRSFLLGVCVDVDRVGGCLLTPLGTVGRSVTAGSSVTTGTAEVFTEPHLVFP